MKLVENYYLPENFPEDTSDTSLRLIGYYFFFMETLAMSNSGEIEEFMSNNKKSKFDEVPFYIRLACYRLLLLQGVSSEAMVDRITSDVAANLPQYNGTNMVLLLKEGDPSINVASCFTQIYSETHRGFNEFYRVKLVPFLTKLFVATPKSMMDFLEPMQYDGYEQLIFFMRLLIYRIALLTEPDNERYLDLAVKDPCSHSTSIIIEEYEPRLNRIRGNRE